MSAFAERARSIVKTIPLRILEGDPTVEVPANVPKEARKHFGWAKKIAEEYLEQAQANGTLFENPEMGTVRYSMIRTLAHERLDLTTFNPRKKEKLKNAITAVCKRGSQKESGFNPNRNNTPENRQRLRQYRNLGEKTAQLLKDLADSERLEIYSTAPFEPLLEKMEIIRTSARPETQNRLNDLWKQDQGTAVTRVNIINTALNGSGFSEIDKQVIAVFTGAIMTDKNMHEDPKLKPAKTVLKDQIKNRALKIAKGTLSATRPQTISDEQADQYFERAIQVARKINDLYEKDPPRPDESRKVQLAMAGPLHLMHLALSGE